MNLFLHLNFYCHFKRKIQINQFANEITRNETHLRSTLLNATLTSVYLSACSSVTMFIKIHTTITQCQIHAVHIVYIFTETD